MTVTGYLILLFQFVTVIGIVLMIGQGIEKSLTVLRSEIFSLRGELFDLKKSLKVAQPPEDLDPNSSDDGTKNEMGIEDVHFKEEKSSCIKASSPVDTETSSISKARSSE